MDHFSVFSRSSYFSCLSSRKITTLYSQFCIARYHPFLHHCNSDLLDFFSDQSQTRWMMWQILITHILWSRGEGDYFDPVCYYSFSFQWLAQYRSSKSHSCRMFYVAEYGDTSFDFSLKPSVIPLNLHSRYGDIVNLKGLRQLLRSGSYSDTPLFPLLALSTGYGLRKNLISPRSLAFTFYPCLMLQTDYFKLLG